jgi:hypothetical protein
MNAEILIQQLGGLGRLRAMIAAHSFMAGANSLNFQFKGSRAANRVAISLENDLYNVAFYAGRGVNVRKVAEQTGVYAESLRQVFEGFTGLYLSI